MVFHESALLLQDHLSWSLRRHLRRRCNLISSLLLRRRQWESRSHPVIEESKGEKRSNIFFSIKLCFFAQLLLTLSTPLSTNKTTFQQHLNSRNWSSADKHFDQVWGGVTGLNRPPGHLRQQRKWGGKSSSLERSQTQLQKRLRAIFGKQYFGLLANLQ